MKNQKLLLILFSYLFVFSGISEVRCDNSSVAIPILNFSNLSDDEISKLPTPKTCSRDLVSPRIATPRETPRERTYSETFMERCWESHYSDRPETSPFSAEDCSVESILDSGSFDLPVTPDITPRTSRIFSLASEISYCESMLELLSNDRGVDCHKCCNLCCDLLRALKAKHKLLRNKHYAYSRKRSDNSLHLVAGLEGLDIDNDEGESLHPSRKRSGNPLQVISSLERLDLGSEEDTPLLPLDSIDCTDCFVSDLNAFDSPRSVASLNAVAASSRVNSRLITEDDAIESPREENLNGLIGQCEAVLTILKTESYEDAVQCIGRLLLYLEYKDHILSYY